MRLAELRINVVVAPVVAEAEKIDISEVVVTLKLLGVFKEVLRRIELDAPKIYICPAAEFRHTFENLRFEYEVLVAGLVGKLLAVLSVLFG